MAAAHVLERKRAGAVGPAIEAWKPRTGDRLRENGAISRPTRESSDPHFLLARGTAMMRTTNGNMQIPINGRSISDMDPRRVSDIAPLHDPTVARLAADTVRKAHAVGLVEESPDFPELTFATLMDVVERVGRAGVAEHAAARLSRVERCDTEGIARLLEEIEALLDESPLPDAEWGRLLGVLEREDLADLLEISPSSTSRYARGERRTPDDVAARLHFLALVVGDLAGAYNEIGIRRWFKRPRGALEGHAPAQLLQDDWDPDDPGPQRVRALARSLVTLPGG